MTGPSDTPTIPESDGGHGEIARQLEAERAAARHWREHSEIQAQHLRDIRRRSWVRVVLRLERTLEPARVRLRQAVRAVARVGERARLSAGAVRSRPTRSARTRHIDRVLEQLADRSSIGREVSVITVPWPSGHATLSELSRQIAGAGSDLVCLRQSTVEPIDPLWLERLAAAIDDDVAVATAHVVHPARSLWRGTSHDLCTRELGIEIDLDDGLPTPRARRAGEVVERGEPHEVDAASSTCLVVRREAVVAAGGLPMLSDVDASVIDLCTSLRRIGRKTVAVPDALVLDTRPVMTRQQLRSPVDPQGTPWRTVVERHGGALVGHRGVAPERLRVAVTTAVPSRRLVDRWGDWGFASALADSFERLGHRVTIQTADEADSLVGRSCDVHLVLRGLTAVRATPGQAHVLWIISHPESITTDECDEADLVLVASERFAASLRQRTSTPVEVLHQATDHRRFRPVPPDPAKHHPVVVVARSRERLRAGVNDAIAAGHPPAIYGSGWEGLVDHDLIIARHVPNEDLPTIYCSAGVVLNDHWDTMKAWGFVSNRLLDVLACGASVISDHLDEIAELLGDSVPTYRDPAELGALIDEALAQPEAARRRASRGRETVIESFTFDARARTLAARFSELVSRARVPRPE
jgi:hypothetical protein